MLHKLGQVEDGLSDLGNGLVGEGLSQVGHQVLLVHWPQLHPAGDKRCVEQLSRQSVVGLGQSPARP